MASQEFSLRAVTSRVPRVTLPFVCLSVLLALCPAGGPSVKGFPVGEPSRSATVGRVAFGPAGEGWFPFTLITTPPPNQFLGVYVGRIADGVITDFLISSQFGYSNLTVGPDGAVWFTLQTAVGRLETAPGPGQGAVVTFPLPETSESPLQITGGPDGNVWFTEYGGGGFGNKIGRITPNGSLTEFVTSTAYSGVLGIVSGPDGNLWFTQQRANRIGRITPSGVVSEFEIPTPSSGPTNITSGPDGNLWFVEQAGNAIGRITPSGQISEFPFPPADYSLSDITSGMDGNLWFTHQGGVGRLTPAGEMNVLVFPLRNGPRTVSTAPDGSLWVTSSFSELLRLDPECPPKGLRRDRRTRRVDFRDSR